MSFFVVLNLCRLRGKTQLQQDSDELWNELVLCKDENKKLLADK